TETTEGDFIAEGGGVR
nr:RecName: Full=Fibrinogen alpha chain; Contains: RecName: Full=Fibrinopeptide A [Ceratotherium simum]prf//721948B fibrinopeptide A [Bitis nasicornis]